LPGLMSDCDPPTFVSWVAGMTDMHHQA
jgi:hypothetical protein